MRKKLSNFFIISALALAGVSVSAQDVYVAGSSSDGATVWLNGSLLYSFGAGSTALSIAVDGEDIYVGGRASGSTEAVVWKNNKKIVLAAIPSPLPIGTTSYSAGVRSVIIYKGDVYALGYTYINVTPPGVGAPPPYRDVVTKVWKNYEELYTLYEERFTGSWRSWMGQGVYDMYIDNGDVYVAGRYVEGPAGNEQFTSLWKNGEPMYTSDVEHQGFSVHVENGTIYTAGIANNYEDANCAPSTGLPGVTLWTNGNPQLLYLDRKYGLDSTYTSTVGPTALIVRNGIAYVGGNVSFNDATAGTFISTAKIWSTDGNNIDLIEHGPTSANALPTVWALYNYNGIYAAVGDEVPSSWDLYAYLWNSSSDDMIELPDIKNATTPSAAPNAIFIVPPSMPIQGLTRQVILKVSDDFVSSKPSGVYYVDSRSDFTFTVTPKGNGVKAVLSTSRIVDDEEKNYKITPRTDGSYDITVYGVNSPLTITVGVEEAAAAEAVAALKVYAAGSQLVIDAPTAGAAQIYSESGALVKTVSYGAGQTTVALSKGIYVITVGKTTAKVVIN